jgi:hypothetical protein
MPVTDADKIALFSAAGHYHSYHLGPLPWRSDVRFLCGRRPERALDGYRRQPEHDDLPLHLHLDHYDHLVSTARIISLL